VLILQLTVLILQNPRARNMLSFPTHTSNLPVVMCRKRPTAVSHIQAIIRWSTQDRKWVIHSFYNISNHLASTRDTARSTAATWPYAILISADTGHSSESEPTATLTTQQSNKHAYICMGLNNIRIWTYRRSSLPLAELVPAAACLAPALRYSAHPQRQRYNCTSDGIR
jgi:hypothetical protein